MSKPDILESAVLASVRQQYGLPVDRLTFLTTGWASYCYKVESATGESYLLKLHDESMPEPLLATSRDFYLPLSHQLCSRKLLSQIPCPVRAGDGRFAVHADHYLMILFHYIDGELVGFGDLSHEILVKLAPLVGRLHQSTGALELENPLVEDFRIAFEKVLPDGLEALAGLNPRGLPGRRGLQELLLSRRAEILGYLDRLKELQTIVRARPGDKVVCHTDLHGGNLLVDSSGDIHILDWEGALLAPPEQDLFLFAGKETFWDLFWPSYKREYSRARLDLNTLGFYYYRRGLEDLAEWLQRLPHADDEQNLRALHWAAQTMAELSSVETKLEKIAAHLARA